MVLVSRSRVARRAVARLAFSVALGLTSLLATPTARAQAVVETLDHCFFKDS
jgi:hypothetical protein